MYKEGISFPSIIERYKEMIDEAKGEMQFAKNIQIFEAKKEDIIPAFVPKESLEIKPELAHVPFENLEIIFRWNIPGTEYSVKLPEEYFNHHQIEPKQFLEELINDPSGVSDVTQPLMNLKTLVISIIGAVGVIILAKNVMEFAQAYQQQDSSSMNSAIKGIVAGLIMAAISSVLTFLGIS